MQLRGYNGEIPLLVTTSTIQPSRVYVNEVIYGKSSDSTGWGSVCLRLELRAPPVEGRAKSQLMANGKQSVSHTSLPPYTLTRGLRATGIGGGRAEGHGSHGLSPTPCHDIW